MLARAATRSFRFQSTPTLLRTTLPFAQSRTYAKHNRPKRPTDDKSPTLSPPVINQDATSASQAPSKHSEHSRVPDESETSASSDPNTSPQSTSPSAIDPAQTVEQGQESQPLPDLTKGIPSTLDAELAEASAKSKPSSLNVTEDPAEVVAGGERGGELPKSAYISSTERKRERLANYMYAFLLGSSILGCIYLGRNWESEEEERKHPNAPSGWGVGLFYNRASTRLTSTMDYFTEPTFPKLLPNVDPAWERPYTLVLSLEDLLVHSEWTREHGWRMAKRPGVDYFLRYLSQYYELVIFTSLPSMTADPIIRKLDPYRIVMWPLYREGTRYQGGEYIKDLAYLNRDLKKVILVDTVEAHAKKQPENAIILPKWKGSLQDKDLVSLIPFLEYVANMGFEDTRSVLKSFEGKHIPTEYARREAIARKKFQEQYAEERAKRPKRSGVGLLGSTLGLGKSPGAGLDGMEPSLSAGFEQGKTLMDQVRERGQKQYELLEKEIRENGHKWLEEMAAEEKKFQEEAMKNMKGGGILSMFVPGGGGGK